MPTELEPIEGATTAQCPDCGHEIMVMPDVVTPTILHHDDGSHTFIPATYSED